MDWTGNKTSIYSTLGASNHSKEERASKDYYATDPKAVELLLNVEKFQPIILEPACGEGHISEVLKKHGYQVLSYDIVDRGYGGIQNFFEFTFWGGDIITNPPYKYALEFIKHAISISLPGSKIAFFLKLQFLEGKKRKPFFQTHPPKVIYVSSSRLKCAKNGDFDSIKSSAVAYAWFIWVNGFKGDPIIRWIN